jgi:hypothetical protein
MIVILRLQAEASLFLRAPSLRSGMTRRATSQVETFRPDRSLPVISSPDFYNPLIDVSWTRVCLASLCSPQHSRSQEVEVRTPIHLPLDRFQAIDLPFHRAIAPRELQCSGHRPVLLAEPNGKVP